MVVDRQPHYYGSRNMLDHHRDMRLDIDNMSYEVNSQTLVCLKPHIDKTKNLVTDIYNHPGTPCSWRKDWECQHWSIGQRNLQLRGSDNVLSIVSTGRPKKMRYLPGKIYLS